MRVLWFVNRISPHRSPMLDSLAGRGVDVLAVYRESGDGGRGWGAHDASHPRITLCGLLPRRVVQLIRESRKFEPDVAVIMGYSTVEHATLWLLARVSGWRLVTRSDSNYLGEPNLSPKKRLLKRLVIRTLIPTDTLVLTVGTVNSRYWKHYGYENQWLVPYQAAPVRHLVELEPRPPTVDLSGDVEFLYVGRLSAEKGVRELVDGFRRLANARPSQSVRLTVIGDGPLRRYCEGVSLDAPIKIEGALPRVEVAKRLATSSVVVVPSKREAWNLVVNEAIELGVPVICSRAVGAAYDLPVIPDLFDPTERGIYEALERLLVTGEIARPSYRQADRETALAAALGSMRI